MENYENVYKKICRTCLSFNNRDNMVSLIDKSDPIGLSCYGKAIPTFAQVSYKKDDKLPLNVCQNCVYLLKQAINFKFTCELSEKRLKQFLEIDPKNNLTNNQIKENICQYLMFKHYFPEINAINTLENKKETIKIEQTKAEIKNVNHLEIPIEFDYKFNLHSNLDSNSSNDTKPLPLPVTTKLRRTHFKQEKSQKHQKKVDKLVLSNDRSLTCSTNNKKEMDRASLTVEKQERNIPCKICNKVLANKMTYRHHMQRHNICEYICDKCGKGFPIITEMHIHQIARHGIGPYLKCDHCSYKAPTKLKLIEHLRLHTGERPFTCEKCGLTFRRQAIWRNHLVYHTEKKFQCKHCPQKFYRHAHMLAHMNNIHERQYVYMCRICNVTYAKTMTVRKHMIAKHGIPREMQGKIIKVNKSVTSFSEK